MTRAAIVLAAVVLTARADATVTLTARLAATQVRVGTAVDLAVEASGGQDVPAPQLAAPDGVTIRYVGPETQVSIVNGHMSGSVTHHFSVAATRPGTFTLGPIAVPYQGATLSAGTVTLQVLPAGAPAGGAASAAGDQLRLVLSTPRTEVFLHEQIPVAVQLRVGNVRVGDLQYPTVAGEGFALDKFPEPTQEQQQTAQGRMQVVTFNSTLTPLKSGPLVVGPAHMEMRKIGRSPFGGFFGDVAGEPLDLASDPLALTVAPLPDADRPASFSGAVGAFDFDVAAAPRELAAGDPVTVTLTIRGRGYLEGVAPPAFTSDDALRVYPVQASPPKPNQPAGSDHVFEPAGWFGFGGDACTG